MTELSLPWETIPLFFIVALLYSSVGHGGASGYLALFALFGVVMASVVQVVLVLNILVASISWWHYYRSGYFSWRIIFPFILSSIPASLLGGLLSIPPQVFSLLLGAALLLAAVRLLFLSEVKADVNGDSKNLWIWGPPIGAGLGFLSGIIGIGGGVFLSPILILLAWADAKRTAAVSSAFIVLNSLSGLGGHLAREAVGLSGATPLVLAVLTGGFLGSQIGAFRFRPKTLQAILAVVLIVAGVKLVDNIF